MAGTTNNSIVIDPSNDNQANVVNSPPASTDSGLVTRPILPVGQEPMAASTPVVVASDQTPLPLGNDVVSTFGYGQTTIGISAVQLANNACTRGVIVKAMNTNSVAVYLGNAAVTTGTGYELGPGESVTIPISNSDLIYAISGTASQNICYVAI
jgi:hypothetical protein